jgi:hypothetical protein
MDIIDISKENLQSKDIINEFNEEQLYLKDISKNEKENLFIDLKENNISNIDDIKELFKIEKNLYIDLSYNKIENISNDIVKLIKEKNNIKFVNLIGNKINEINDNNKIIIDEKNKEFKNWFDDNEIKSKSIYFDVKKKSPELKSIIKNANKNDINYLKVLRSLYREGILGLRGSPKKVFELDDKIDELENEMQKLNI